MTDTDDTPLGSARLHDTRIARYDDLWSEAEGLARQLVAAGLPMDAVVARVAERQRGPYSGVVPAGMISQLAHVDLGRFAGLPPPHRLVVAHGRYADRVEWAHFEILAEAVLAMLDPEVDCLVEFGSGTGLNLARLALVLGDRGRSLTYVACEPSSSGRRTGGLLFANGAHRLMSEDFDFTAPQMPFLGQFRRIVAFTCHAIEQIPLLGPALYEAMLRHPVAACVHLEPVGWQRFSNLEPVVLEAHRDLNRCSWFRSDYRYVVADDRLVENAAAWSAAHLYNTDLLRQVAAADAAGKIVIQRLDYDIVGESPFNPSTRIAWRR